MDIPCPSHATLIDRSIIFGEGCKLWRSRTSYHFRLRSKYSPQHPVLNHPQSMKSCVFWEITPCGSFKFNRSFGGTCRLHLQDLPWRRRLNIPPRQLTFNGLYGVACRKIEFFMTTAVRTSDPKPSVYVLPLMSETKFHTHKKLHAKL
jgi:hypothetical protein